MEGLEAFGSILYHLELKVRAGGSSAGVCRTAASRAWSNTHPVVTQQRCLSDHTGADGLVSEVF